MATQSRARKNVSRNSEKGDFGREMLPNEGFKWGRTWKVINLKRARASGQKEGNLLYGTQTIGGRLFRWE